LKHKDSLISNYKYVVNKPVKFVDHFTIQNDSSIWNGEYVKINNVMVPDRPQTIKLKEVFNNISDYSNKYCTSGLYLLFFKNLQVYYVGIAAFHVKSPESIENRLKKHIAKINGINVGNGINHTNSKGKGWRFYSLKVLNNSKRLNQNYNFEDLFLVTINVDKHYMYTNLKTGDDKKRLEFIEKKLSDPKHPIITKTLNYIGENNSEWHSFNHTSQGINHQHNFKFWN